MIDIFGTLGPACAQAETLAEMLRLGMTGVRLNLSHVTLPEAAPLTEALHRAAQRSGIQPKLLIDMQGPELRVGRFAEPLSLPEGVVIATEALHLPPCARELLCPGQEILLDDGKLLLMCETAETARVVRGGVLLSRKSAALPGQSLSLPALTEADRENLALARDFGVTGVMQPFVRSRDDLVAVRAALPVGIRLYAKIENLAGVSRLEEILDEADEIVIARGDLGNAVPLWELPALQKRISVKSGLPAQLLQRVLQRLGGGLAGAAGEGGDGGVDHVGARLNSFEVGHERQAGGGVRVHHDRQIHRVLDGGDQIVGVLGRQDARHILDADGGSAHGLELADDLHVLFQGVHGAGGI